MVLDLFATLASMEKQRQVLVIHGGDAFATQEEYVSFLESCTVSLADGRGRGWKSRLIESLGSEYGVTLPRMPNPLNARYAEWKLWFEKYIPLLEDGVVLVGHSFGGSFLAKYLSEERFPKKIRATFIIAAPYDKDSNRDVVEFVLPQSLALLQDQGGEVYLYHSKDDQVVAFSELEKYTKELPSAHTRIFEDRGHFLQEELPEIVEDIQSLR